MRQIFKTDGGSGLQRLIQKHFKLVNNFNAGFMHYIAGKHEKARAQKHQNNIPQRCFLLHEKILRQLKKNSARENRCYGEHNGVGQLEQVIGEYEPER